MECPFLCGETNHSGSKDDHRDPHTRLEIPDKSIFIIALTLGVSAFLLSLACLVFNYILRDNRIIKLSSPRLNMVIACGGIIASLSCILEGADYFLSVKTFGTQILCHSRHALLCVSVSLVYGPMLGRTWRVNRIFKLAGSKRVVIKDQRLLLLTLILVLLDGLVITAWGLTDPLEYRYSYILDTDTHQSQCEITPSDVIIIPTCTSKWYTLWSFAFVVFKLPILMAGLRESWWTRGRILPRINDSTPLAVSVLVTITMVTVAAVTSLAFVPRPNVTKGCSIVCLWICIVVTIAAVCVPKLVLWMRAPKGRMSRLSISSINSTSAVLQSFDQLDSELTTANAEIETLKLFIREKETNIEKLQKLLTNAENRLSQINRDAGVAIPFVDQSNAFDQLPQDYTLSEKFWKTGDPPHLPPSYPQDVGENHHSSSINLPKDVNNNNNNIMNTRLLVKNNTANNTYLLSSEMNQIPYNHPCQYPPCQDRRPSLHSTNTSTTSSDNNTTTGRRVSMPEDYNVSNFSQKSRYNSNNKSSTTTNNSTTNTNHNINPKINITNNNTPYQHDYHHHHHHHPDSNNNNDNNSSNYGMGVQNMLNYILDIAGHSSDQNNLPTERRTSIQRSPSPMSPCNEHTNNNINNINNTNNHVISNITVNTNYHHQDNDTHHHLMNYGDDNNNRISIEYNDINTGPMQFGTMYRHPDEPERRYNLRRRRSSTGSTASLSKLSKLRSDLNDAFQISEALRHGLSSSNDPETMERYKRQVKMAQRARRQSVHGFQNNITESIMASYDFQRTADNQSFISDCISSNDTNTDGGGSRKVGGMRNNSASFSIQNKSNRKRHHSACNYYFPYDQSGNLSLGITLDNISNTNTNNTTSPAHGGNDVIHTISRDVTDGYSSSPKTTGRISPAALYDLNSVEIEHYNNIDIRTFARGNSPTISVPTIQFTTSGGFDRSSRLTSDSLYPEVGSGSTIGRFDMAANRSGMQTIHSSQSSRLADNNLNERRSVDKKADNPAVINTRRCYVDKSPTPQNKHGNSNYDNNSGRLNINPTTYGVLLTKPKSGIPETRNGKGNRVTFADANKVLRSENRANIRMGLDPRRKPRFHRSQSDNTLSRHDSKDTMDSIELADDFLAFTPTTSHDDNNGRIILTEVDYSARDITADIEDETPRMSELSIVSRNFSDRGRVDQVLHSRNCFGHGGPYLNIHDGQDDMMGEQCWSSHSTHSFA